MKINNISTQLYKQNNQCKGIKADNAPAFKGPIPDALAKAKGVFVEKGSSRYEKLATSELFTKAVGKAAKSNNAITALMLAESIYLSSFYMLSTLFNKKIDKEQKPQMIINDALVLGVSSATTLFLDKSINGLYQKLLDKHFANPKTKEFYIELGQKVQEQLGANSNKNQLLGKVKDQLLGKVSEGAEQATTMLENQLEGLAGKTGKLKPFAISKAQLSEIKTGVENAIKNAGGNVENAQKAVGGLVDDVYTKLAAQNEINKIEKGLKKLKSVVIFGLVYRYLGPVVVTPIANKISAKLVKNKTEKQVAPEKK